MGPMAYMPSVAMFRGSLFAQPRVFLPLVVPPPQRYASLPRGTQDEQKSQIDYRKAYHCVRSTVAKIIQ